VTFIRYSEPYQPTGGLAAEGVMNQLGRPDIEPLEVLVREAVQNCWDARRETELSIRVEIARRQLDAPAVAIIAERVLVDPSPDVPLAEELRPGMRIMHFADFGTSGLGGPTRADQVGDGTPRDFVDFVRNIGQPPDKDFGGGSFGYGKAAFYIASRARTIVIDTMCETSDGLERRLIGAALGTNHTQADRSYTGRHWWGTMVDEVPEPLTGEDAAQTAALLGLPAREGRDGLGTTIAIIAPGLEPDDDPDAVMAFVADALIWNFWPKMISTPGGIRATIKFQLTDDGEPVPIPDPRTHSRLRGFVEAMDRLRTEPDETDPTVIDRPVASQRPIQHLGRVVIQKGPVAPVVLPEGRSVPEGVRVTAGGVHHVALMRNAELVVKYLAGPEATTGRFGYAGVFRCSHDTDQAFRSAEPPTHDDWIARAVPERRERVFVNVALKRVQHACREAAGYGATTAVLTEGADIPLGEFADGLARLMSGFDGPGARRASRTTGNRPRRRNAPGRRTVASEQVDAGWVEGDGTTSETTADSSLRAPDADPPGPAEPLDRLLPTRPKPVLRVGGDPSPSIAADGTAVMRYPFELRSKGNPVRLQATVRVMTNDGESVESDPPRGWIAPSVRAWIDPAGVEHLTSEIDRSPDSADGSWVVEIPIVEDVVIGVDIVSAVIQ
jgi:hypothetical protein